MNKQIGLCVATPMYGGMCYGQYMGSMMRLQVVCGQNNIPLIHLELSNESLITRARNFLVHKFLQLEGFTHLMFIDSDIKFNADDIIQMIQADKDIICGVYSRKEIDWSSVKVAATNGVPADKLQYFGGSSFTTLINNDQPSSWHDPVEIKHGGTGFMLIKREVFEQLKETTQCYKTEYDEIIYNFFETLLSEVKDSEHLDLLSEDYSFCKKWRDIGGQVYAAPWVWLDHMGTYKYSGAFGRIPNEQSM